MEEIYYGINLVITLLMTIHRFSWRGLIIAVLANIILFFIITYYEKYNEYAAESLGIFVFFDILELVGLYSETLQKHMDMSQFGILLHKFTPIIILILIIFIALWLIATFIKEKKVEWLKWFSVEAIGIIIIFFLFGKGDIKEIYLIDGIGRTIMVLYIAATTLWFFCTQIVLMLNLEKWISCTITGTILFIGTIFLLITENNFIKSSSNIILDFYQNMNTGIFAWWNVLFGVAVLVITGIIAHTSEELYIDEIICYSLASGILNAKILFRNYFSHSWILFVVFSVITLRLISTLKELLKKEDKLSQDVFDKKLMFKLSTAIAMPFAMWIAAKWMKNGMWLNVVLTVLIGILYYRQIKSIMKREKKGIQGICNDSKIWYYLLIGIALEIIVWVWARHYHVDKLVIVACALVIAYFVILIFNFPHPSGRKPSYGYKIGVCAFFTIICLVSVHKYGADIHVDMDVEKENQLSVEIESKGKENTIAVVTYEWKNAFYQTVNIDSVQVNTDTISKEMNIKAEHLIIKVVDSNGVETVENVWFHEWMTASK